MDARFGCGVSVFFDNEAKYLAAFKIAVALSSLTKPVSGFCWKPWRSLVMLGVRAQRAGLKTAERDLGNLWLGGGEMAEVCLCLRDLLLSCLYSPVQMCLTWGLQQ